MNQTILLTFMLVAYIAPVAFVYYKYNTGVPRSISSIITSQEPFFNDIAPLFQTRYVIALCMFIMAAFTLVYEYQRCVEYLNSRMWSLASIAVLLIGIFGVIFIPEHDSTHYVYAGAAFIAIVGFMAGHTFCSGADTDIHDILRILLYAQFLFMLVTVMGVLQDTAIFTIEALFLANFAVFYLYLHYHTFCSSCSSEWSSSMNRCRSSAIESGSSRASLLPRIPLPIRAIPTR
jgi:hypothetical protein